MLTSINANKILFLDIETVPDFEDWQELPQRKQALFEKKTRYKREMEELPIADFYNERAGIWAEFGRIICISCGIIVNKNEFRVKSFYGDSEQKILEEFAVLLNKSYATEDSILCAHNGKEFDFPYIARRMIIHSIALPKILNLFGKKPWQVQHLDTMELWRFGDYKSFTSLDLLAELLNIPTPKDDIDGSMVATVYYKEKNIERIKTYCEKDVLTTAQIFRKFRGEELLSLQND